MIFVDNERVTDPRINLAIEEHLLRNPEISDDILLFYINEPSIIIGRNQNTLEEINHEYVEANGVHVVRRLSGGGAVYHDLGNLNYSFITNNGNNNFHNFQKFTAPVIDVLQGMGVQAELSGRNDILVDGRKISGNAQYSTSTRMFHHGTLLFSSKLENVGDALNVKMGKITSKGIKSVRSRVANITEFTNHDMDVEGFRERLLSGIFGGSKQISRYELTDQDWTAIQDLSKERYANWDWNFGKSPDFNLRKTHRFPIGEIDVCIDVQKGSIRAIKIYGDFLGQGEVAEIEKRLVGARFERMSLEEALAALDVSYYFGGLTNEEFTRFLY